MHHPGAGGCVVVGVREGVVYAVHEGHVRGRGWLLVVEGGDIAWDVVPEVAQGGHPVDTCLPFPRLGISRGSAGWGVGHVWLVVAGVALGVHPPRNEVSDQVSPPVNGGYRNLVPCWGRALAVRGGERGAVVSGDVEEGAEEEVSDALPPGWPPGRGWMPGCAGWCWRCGGVAPPDLPGPRGAAVPLRGCVGRSVEPVRWPVVRGVVRGLVWVEGGGGRCRMRGLVMSFPLVAAGGGICSGVCRRGLGVAGVGGGLRLMRQWPGPSGRARGDGVRVALLVAGVRGWVLCWTGVWASCWVVWVLRVRAVCFLWSLACRGVRVRVAGECLGIRVGLWSVGSGWLLVDGACWHGLPLMGLPVVVGCSL